MGGPAIKIEAFIYGHGESRMEFDVQIPINPPSLSTNLRKLDAYAKDCVRDLMIDMKSSHQVLCSNCGKEARENYLTTASFLHLPPKGVEWMGQPSPGPSMALYVSDIFALFHHIYLVICAQISAVCSMNGPCGNAARMQGSFITSMPSWNPPPPEVPIDIFDKTVYPLNGSCAGCLEDKTAKASEKLLRCGTCKTVQYCGAKW